MKNQLKNINEITGKTIADFVLYYGDVWLKFTDNTFAVLTIKDITEGFGYGKEEIVVDNYDKDCTYSPLVELDIITKMQYNEACEKEEIEMENRRKELERHEEEKTRQLELQQLRELKSKYGL